MTWTAKASATPIAMARPASTKRIGKARNSPAISQRHAVVPVSAIGGDKAMRREQELPVGCCRSERRMRDEQHRRAALLHRLAEQRDDLCRGVGVEIAG